jgi:hypothetical protein
MSKRELLALLSALVYRAEQQYPRLAAVENAEAILKEISARAKKGRYAE